MKLGCSRFCSVRFEEENESGWEEEEKQKEVWGVGEVSYGEEEGEDEDEEVC